jgi:hypothetical protein
MNGKQCRAAPPKPPEAAVTQPGLPVTGFTKRTTLPYAVRRAADYCPDISIENITRRIGYASYVNVERRYMYCQVSKAGCTSMKWLLHSLERLPPIEYFVGSQRESRRDMFIHERGNLKIPSLLDLDDATQELVLTSPQFMRFTVVRNPYTRTESAWKDKVRLCAPTYERFYRAIKGKLPTGNDSSSLVSFQEFVNAISREDLVNCDAHWRLQVAQTLRGALNFSHIGHLEDFSTIIGILHAHLGAAQSQRSTNLNRTAGASHYDEDIAKAVYALYRQDFEAFGYDPDSWVRPSNENKPSVVSESIFVDEVLERNIVIGHLYEERDALKHRVQELERSLRGISKDTQVLEPILPAKDDELLRRALVALNGRPHGTKPLYELAKYYREQRMNAASALVCEAALAAPRPERDGSSLEDHTYTVGLLEEYSIAANYSDDPERKDRGFAACNWLALDREVPTGPRGLARHNLRFYVQPADKMMPSFAARPVGFTPPDGYHPTNPSVARQGEQIVLVQRCVNYTHGDGQYHTPSGEPSRTRNFLLRLNGNLDIQSSTEILLPLNLPKPAPGVATVFADLRLFAWGGELWCNGYFRELTPTGLCQQVLARIDESGQRPCRLADWRVLVPEGSPQHEKNWMPLVAGEMLKFIYRCDPTRVVDEAARTVAETTPAIAAEEFRGGTQAIDFDGGRLALIHEVMPGACEKQRVYHHRFVWFDAADALRRVSRPFFFRKKGIEFAAGLAWHPDGKRLLISYGVDDGEAWIATIAASEVLSVLDVANGVSPKIAR